MSSQSRSQTGRPSNMSIRPSSGPFPGAAPLSDPLARSAVCRRLPLLLRTQVDEAIIRRPKEFPTLEAIAAHFDLTAYGVSMPALRTYARRLEALARPTATSQLLSVVLGCLPARYRRRTLDGTQVLLISRVAQALSIGGPPLSPAELARFGSLLAAMGRAPEKTAGAKRTHRNRILNGHKEIQPDRLIRDVRRVYNVSLPPPSP